ncbi:MAG TPA: hypothetical protein VMV46_07035 [Thermoanaerobaculia bacterium]|nr:hypothetical protein [Thermoanaerobaculia bacterium]
MSERARERDHRVRRALHEWDEARVGREPSTERVARMRASLLASAEAAVADREVRDGSRPGLPRAGWVVAAVAVLLALVLGWAAARRAFERAAPPATAVNADAPAREVGVPPGAGQPIREQDPERVAEASPASPAPPRDVLPAAAPTLPTDAPRIDTLPTEPAASAVVGDTSALAAAVRPVAPRRVRRLDFEAPSGRKIHWILDSEFRGIGGR